MAQQTGAIQLSIQSLVFLSFFLPHVLSSWLFREAMAGAKRALLLEKLAQPDGKDLAQLRVDLIRTMLPTASSYNRMVVFLQAEDDQGDEKKEEDGQGHSFSSRLVVYSVQPNNGLLDVPDEQDPKLKQVQVALQRDFVGFLTHHIEWEKWTDNHSTSWYTDKGWEVDYEYEGRAPQPHHTMPEWMLCMRDHMMETLLLAGDEETRRDLERLGPPNSCNWNWYKDGRAGLGAHADDEDLFDGRRRRIHVVGFSVGAARSFEVVRGAEGAPAAAQRTAAKATLPALSYCA
ncbi:unnamed protein product, partial [Heterosigma akashiwo]